MLVVWISAGCSVDQTKRQDKTVGLRPRLSFFCESTAMQQDNQSNPTNRLSVIRMSQLCSTPKSQGKLPVSAPTLWRWIKQGKFPAPFKLGQNTTVWDASEVAAWIEEQKGAQQ
jgi:predicted DNA-binding transcriptional regulator AlpA